MLCLQTVLAGLMLFFPAIYALATPDEAAIGKVRGFTGPVNAKPREGDYLTATFCYCAYPPRMEAVMGPAHFYQFEYYNYRHDTTFILTSACPDGDIGFDRVCVPPSGGVKVLAGKTMDWNCKEWDGYEDMGDDGKAKRKDRLCYIPRFKHNVDYIRFNGQWRNLGAKGRQGPAVRDMAPGTCENLCQENMGMPELQDDNYPPSHQIEWTNLDDMCYNCK